MEKRLIRDEAKGIAMHLLYENEYKNQIISALSSTYDNSTVKLHMQNQ